MWECVVRMKAREYFLEFSEDRDAWRNSVSCLVSSLNRHYILSLEVLEGEGVGVRLAGLRGPQELVN